MNVVRTIFSKGSKIVRSALSFRWVKQSWMYSVRIVERMEDNHIFLSAGAIAFNTLLCFIPLILIVFYILGLYLDSESAFQTIESYIDSLELFPVQKDQLKELTLGVVKEFISGSHIAGIVGAIGLIWTGSALFATVRTVLNRIYNIKDTKNLLLSKLRDITLLTLIGICLLVVTILLYSVAFIQFIESDLLMELQRNWLIDQILTGATSVLISFFVFCIMFLMIPDKRLSLRSIFISSMWGAFFWSTAKVLFGYYVSNLWSIGRIYGPYALLAAIAIWVYYSSITILVAAEIGEMSIERRRLKKLFTTDELGNFTRARKTRLRLTFVEQKSLSSEPKRKG